MVGGGGICKRFKLAVVAGDALPQAQPVSERVQDIEPAVRPGILQRHVRRGRHHLLGRSPTEDALRQPSQPLAGLGIDPPKIVDDTGLGLACQRVTRGKRANRAFSLQSRVR
jgi:hypothetical protein